MYRWRVRVCICHNVPFSSMDAHTSTYMYIHVQCTYYIYISIYTSIRSEWRHTAQLSIQSVSEFKHQNRNLGEWEEPAYTMLLIVNSPQ